LTVCVLADPKTEAFMELVRDAFRRLRANDAEAALALLSQLVEDDAFAAFHVRALNYRATVLELLERFDDARADLLAAHALSQPATQERYTTELGLAHNAKHRDDAADELAWLRSALATAAAASDPTLGGFVVAAAVLDRVGDAISTEERSLIEATIRQGWPILELDGEPAFADLRATLTRMRERSGDKDYWSHRS
jgi:hypothetical protein